VTDTLLDPNDTGEIPRPVGEHRMRIDTGEKTQRIDPRLIKAPSFDAIPRKAFDLEDTVVYHRDTVVYHLPPSIGVIPDPETVTLTLLGSLTAAPNGDLRPAAPGPRPGPLPPTPPPAPKPRYVGRHRLSWNGRARRLLAQVGVAGAFVLAVWAGLVLAALVVVR
jgi:hypothetical protein